MADSDGKEARRIITREHERLTILFWSADGSRLSFTSGPMTSLTDPTVTLSGFASHGAARTYNSVVVDTGHVDAPLPGVNIEYAVSSGQTRVLFLSPSANRDGNDLWQVETDSRTAMPRGSPRRLPIRTDWIKDITISADGRRMTAVRLTSSPSVHIGDYDARGPRISNVRLLTLDTTASFPHSWTADSRAVIFEAVRRKSRDLFRQNIDARVADNIAATPMSDFHPALSPDGKWFLFLQAAPGTMIPAALARVPVVGGTPEELLPKGQIDEFSCALPGGQRCVARRTEGKEWYTFHELDPTRGIGRELARTSWMPVVYGDWALSPDGAEVALPVRDRSSARIRLISLDNPVSAGAEREITLDRFVNINGLNWTADGKGWFVVITTSIDRHLIHVDRRARVTPLLDRAGYAISSPDGKKVALMIPFMLTNVWSFEGV